MATNRNALIRYKTIDQCLQNRQRKWTLDDLITKVSDMLYEYEGRRDDISKRTIQLDIQNMRSDKLGYNAPIVVVDRKYYTYADPSYSITKMPISKQDLSKLSDAVDFLKQFQGFSHFQELSGMVQKLEDRVFSVKSKKIPIIDFETIPNLKGIEYLDQLYRAILEKKVLKISYQSFKARQADEFSFHPYLLKEFNNRWFLLGAKNENKEVLILALDRMVNIYHDEHTKYLKSQDFDPSTFFKDVVGVTVMKGMLVEKITIIADHQNAPYILTKPIHHSQKVIETNEKGVLFELNLKINFELERLLLGFGESVEVIAPRRLRTRMKKRFELGLEKYQQ